MTWTGASPRHVGVAVGALLAALLVGATASPLVAAAVTAAVCLLLLTALPTKALVGLFLLSTFITRYGVEVQGVTLRAEYLAGVLLALSLAHRCVAEPVDARRRAVLLTLLTYLAYSTAVTVLFADDPVSSVTVLAWFASDCLILAALLRVPGLSRTLVRQGTSLACAHALLGTLAWLIANAGGLRWGVQEDPAYGGLAAYGLSFEANIFAGTTAVWAIVALAGPRGWTLRGVRPALLLLAPVVALVSHTRAALVALLAGMAVLLVAQSTERVRGKVLSALAGMVVLIPLGLVAEVPGSDAIVSKFSETLDPDTANVRFRLESSSEALKDLTGPSAVVLGLGTNSFGQRHVQRRSDGALVPSYISNLPLQVLYDTGLAGFIVLGLGLRRAMRNRINAGRGAAVLVALVVVSLSTSFFWFAATWVFVLIGCSDLPDDEPDSLEEPSCSPDGRDALVGVGQRRATH